MLENIKCHYKRDLLLHLLNEEEVGSMNIAEFCTTLKINDAVLMSAKSWDEVEAGTITNSWSKLSKFPDAA